MTIYAVDFSSIRWIFIYDDREVYPMVRRLGNTVDRPTEITKPATLSNTLSRPPPKGGFCFGGACSFPQFPSTRRKVDLRAPAIFGQSKIAHGSAKQNPETLYILHKRNF